MLGRVLFTFVWLIIAAGLVLPLYPGDEMISVVTAASDPIQPVAASDAFGCEDCPSPMAAPTAAPIAHAIPWCLRSSCRSRMGWA